MNLHTIQSVSACIASTISMISFRFSSIVFFYLIFTKKLH